MFLCVLMQHNVVFNLPDIWEEEDFLCLGCWHTDLFACFFPGSCLRQPIQNRPVALLPHTLFFPEIELFPHSGEQNLCATFHGTVMHQQKLREDTFLLYIVKIILLWGSQAEWEGKEVLSSSFLLPALQCGQWLCCCWLFAGQQHKAPWAPGRQATGVKDGSGGESCLELFRLSMANLCSG